MSEMEGDRKLERARVIVRRKIGFLRHFFVFVVVLVGLAIINNVTYGGYQWWLWVALGWGVGVSIHFLTAFLIAGGDLERRMLQREMEKLDDER